jgi:hypothetical protein
MIAVVDGAAVAGSGNSFCFDNRGDSNMAPPVCQEVPVETTTSVSTSTWTVTQGVSTVTRTATILENPRDHHHHRHQRHQQQRGPRVRDADLDPFDFKSSKLSNCTNRCPEGFCDAVCPFQYPTLRIIKVVVQYWQADDVCRKHGWRLAGMTAGNIAEIIDLFGLCVGGMHPFDFNTQGLPQALWIRSYNGVAAAACNAFFTDPQLFGNHGAGMAFSNAICNSLTSANSVYVLCQTDGPDAPPDDGGWVGQPTTTTTSTNTTVMSVIPSATTTTTETLTETCCKKHKGDPEH